MKNISKVLVIGMLVLAVMPRASRAAEEVATDLKPVDKGAKIEARIAEKKAMMACRSGVMEKKVATARQSSDALEQKLKDARTARQTALDAAKLLTDKTARRAAIKAAQETFMTARKGSMEEMRLAHKTTQDQFKLDMKACLPVKK